MCDVVAARGAAVALNDLLAMIEETHRSAERLRAEYGARCLALAGDVTNEEAARESPYRPGHSPRLRRLDGSFTNW